MAGNNSIQILRGSSSAIANSSETLLDGQMIYNTDKNYLTIGANGNSTPVNSEPIACRKLVGYSGDSDDSIGNNTTVIGQITIGHDDSVRQEPIININSSNVEIDALDVFVSPNTTATGKIQIGYNGATSSGVARTTEIHGTTVNIASHSAGTLIPGSINVSSSGNLVLTATNGVSVNSSLSICSATKNAYMLYNEVADSFFVSSAGYIEMHAMGGMAGATTLMMASNSISFMVNSKTVNVSNQAGTMPVVFNGSTAVNKLQFTLSGTTLTITTT